MVDRVLGSGNQGVVQNRERDDGGGKGGGDGAERVGDLWAGKRSVDKKNVKKELFSYRF